MALFISIILISVGLTLVGIGGNAWSRGGYSNYVLAGIWGIAGYLIFGFGAWFTYYSYVIKPAKAAELVNKRAAALPRYVASYKVAIVPQRGERGLAGVYWFAYKSRLGDTLSPIPIMLFVRISMHIDSYTIDAQNKRGEWVRLWRMDTKSGEVYTLSKAHNRPKATARIDLSHDGFSENLYTAGRQIAPNGGFVEGWIALDHPEGFDDGTPYRINIRDKIGETTIPINGPQGGSAKMQPVQTNKDFLGYTMTMYSDAVGK